MNMKVENEMTLPTTKSVMVMLLEPYAGKLARTVLRGESSRKGADLLDASSLDVNASRVTDSEIDSCLVSDIILGGGLSYKCGNFHYASSLVYHFHKFAFHLIVNRAVAVECTAALHMSRHGCYQVGVGNLSVQIAYKSLPCRVAGGYLV